MNVVKMVEAVAVLPNWVYGKEFLLKVLFGYAMINAMAKSNKASKKLKA